MLAMALDGTINGTIPSKDMASAAGLVVFLFVIGIHLLLRRHQEEANANYLKTDEDRPAIQLKSLPETCEPQQVTMMSQKNFEAELHSSFVCMTPMKLRRGAVRVHGDTLASTW